MSIRESVHPVSHPVLEPHLGTVKEWIDRITWQSPETGSAILGGDAAVTELVHLLDRRETAYHLMLCQSPQCVKVEMTEPRVPQPSVVLTAS